jgi:hypothetical protein
MGYAIQGNIKMVYLAIRYAKFQGVKAGESFMKQLLEVMKRHPEWVDSVKPCDKDADQMTGELRESGKKVLNINEVDRQAELRRQKESEHDSM